MPDSDSHPAGAGLIAIAIFSFIYLSPSSFVDTDPDFDFDPDFSVDHSFFQPDTLPSKIRRPYALSVGSETKKGRVVLATNIDCAFIRNLIFHSHTPVTGVYQQAP